MNTPSLRALALFIVALAATAFYALAAERSPEPQIAEASLAGLQVSLTTSGYKFLLGELDAPAAAGAAEPRPAREWFVASALLANRSNTDIDFTFPTPVAAQVRWTFRIFDHRGVQLWRSDEGVVSAQVLTEVTLDKRARWKRLIQVPLRIDGRLLEPGTYTLEASIDSDKTLGASATFEVALPAVPPGPAKDSGLEGRVLFPGEGDLPVPGALINIMELSPNAAPLKRAPFLWFGQADEMGKFRVVAPPGRYRVTASPGPRSKVSLEIDRTVPPLPKSVEVTVMPGKFSEVIIRLDPAVPPEIGTGIQGLVLYGPVTPVAIPGRPDAVPLGGAHVRVEEIRAPESAAPGSAIRLGGRDERSGPFPSPDPAGQIQGDGDGWISAHQPRRGDGGSRSFFRGHGPRGQRDSLTAPRPRVRISARLSAAMPASRACRRSCIRGACSPGKAARRAVPAR